MGGNGGLSFPLLLRVEAGGRLLLPPPPPLLLLAVGLLLLPLRLAEPLGTGIGRRGAGGGVGGCRRRGPRRRLGLESVPHFLVGCPTTLSHRLEWRSPSRRRRCQNVWRSHRWPRGQCGGSRGRRGRGRGSGGGRRGSGRGRDGLRKVHLPGTVLGTNWGIKVPRGRIASKEPITCVDNKISKSCCVCVALFFAVP